MKPSAHRRWIADPKVLLAAATLVLLAVGCRQDMHVQPRYNPYDASTAFDDGRSARLPVPGTIARGQLHLDALLYTGKVDGKDAEVFPFPITRADLDRGRERFNIYCSPCHDVTGQRPRHDRAARISAAAIVPH